MTIYNMDDKLRRAWNGGGGGGSLVLKILINFLLHFW